MSDTVILSIIATIGSIIQAYMVYLVRRIHTATNSMKDELIATTKVIAEDKGIAIGLTADVKPHDAQTIALAVAVAKIAVLEDQIKRQALATPIPVTAIETA